MILFPMEMICFFVWLLIQLCCSEVFQLVNTRCPGHQRPLPCGSVSLPGAVRMGPRESVQCRESAVGHLHLPFLGEEPPPRVEGTPRACGPSLPCLTSLLQDTRTRCLCSRGAGADSSQAMEGHWWGQRDSSPFPGGGRCNVTGLADSCPAT